MVVMMTTGGCHKRHSDDNTPTWQRSRGYGQRLGARRKCASDTAHEKIGGVRRDQRQELNMLKMLRLHQ